MKRLSVIGLVSVVLAIAIFALLPRNESDAAAKFGGSRANCHTQGTNCPCNHMTVQVDMGGTSYFANFTGSITLDCIDTGTTQSGLWWWKQIPRAFGGNGTNATLGILHVYLDSNRTCDTAQMTSNVLGQDFPRTHDVYAWAKMTLSSQPGKVYVSKQQFHMHNGAIPSFGVPGSQLTYAVMTDVEFEDSQLPGPTVINVRASPLVVNP